MTLPIQRFGNRASRRMDWIGELGLREDTQHVDPARWSPLLYVFRHYFGTWAALGKTFKADL